SIFGGSWGEQRRCAIRPAHVVARRLRSGSDVQSRVELVACWRRRKPRLLGEQIFHGNFVNAGGRNTLFDGLEPVRFEQLEDARIFSDGLPGDAIYMLFVEELSNGSNRNPTFIAREPKYGVRSQRLAKVFIGP